MQRRVSLLVGLANFSTLTNYFRSAIKLIIIQKANCLSPVQHLATSAGSTKYFSGYAIHMLYISGCIELGPCPIDMLISAGQCTRMAHS